MPSSKPAHDDPEVQLRWPGMDDDREGSAGSASEGSATPPPKAGPHTLRLHLAARETDEVRPLPDPLDADPAHDEEEPLSGPGPSHTELHRLSTEVSRLRADVNRLRQRVENLEA